MDIFVSWAGTRDDWRHAIFPGYLPAWPPRQRAAVTSLAHRGEFGGVPAAATGPGRARPRRGLWPGHDHRVPGGDVTGIDAAADVLGTARQEAEGRGLANVSFGTGDVYHLDFADGTFDVVHAHQVLQHLTDPVAALREMRRVCRAGGIVAARDGDY